MEELGKIIFNLGIILIIIGALISLLSKIPFLGKLPGDIFYKSENVQVYFPITTLILISIVISIILSIIANLKK